MVKDVIVSSECKNKKSFFEFPPSLRLTPDAAFGSMLMNRTEFSPGVSNSQPPVGFPEILVLINWIRFV